MAIPATAVWEMNASATAPISNLIVNAGGFNPANANMLTDLATNANTANTSAPVVSSASYNFVAGDAGNWLYVKAGTSWQAGWYKIASVDGATHKATLSCAIASASVVITDSTAGYPTPRYKASTVTGCTSDNSVTLSGGTFTMDYSQGTGAFIGQTDGACTAGSSTFTQTTSTFTKVMVGNFLRIRTGSGGFTAGWYEIVSWTDANTVVLDSAGASGTNGTSITFAVGGAICINSTNDSAWFNKPLGTNGTGGNRVFMKAGTHTAGQAITITTTGGTQAPVVIEGYNSTRGDAPIGSNRPTLAMGANAFTLAANWDVYNLSLTGTAANVLVFGSSGKAFNVKAVNSSTTASRNAIQLGSNLFLFNTEAVSYRGRAINTNSASCVMEALYVHDSDIGVLDSGGASIVTVKNSILEGNATAAYNLSGGGAGLHYITGTTIYGAENKLGIGVSLVTGSTNIRVENSILYGLATGVSHADTQTVGYDDYNDYNNNTSDVSNWQKGANDSALNPTFTSVTQRTGSSATTTAGNHLVQSGATFQTWGITAGVDVLYLVSGTGTTNTTHYSILSVDSETQITVGETLTANATADHVWQITQGHNFAIGTNLKALGFPGAFQGGFTTGYIDIGAVQRQESGTSGVKVYAGLEGGANG